MPIKVLLDTNFLLIPGQFRIDIFSEINRVCRFSYEICALDRTLEELEEIAASQKGLDKSSAILGLKLVKSGKVRVLGTKTATFKNVDRIISDFAAAEHCIVATQDKALRARLPEGTKIIMMRQGKHLELIE